MANNLLPVRAGEFARAYVASRHLPVRFSTALASVGVERVLDGLMLVSLMAVAIGSSAFPHQADIGRTSVSAITTTAAAVFGAVLVVAVLVVHRPAPPLALPKREFMEHARQIWDELGLPALKPQPPWHGYSLGDWDDVWDTYAERAVAGQWETTGRETFARRRAGLTPETPVKSVKE